ncbi:TRAP transporter small permease subunit [Flexithrix dorotheae]|uniref:TRAP transporter small permease subunit n=1 Tax=Flexithrix dorotheae TaxID=70993 RepID=UPI0005C5D0B4|nr:TRAP transporter small permease subunit [Flexithrix dorotheae]
MKFLQTYIHIVNQINENLGRAIAWLSSILVIVICLDVAIKNIFSISSVAFFELQWHLFALIFLLGAAYTLKHDKHVRVDVFYQKLSPKGQAWVNIIGSIIFLIPFCIIIIKSSLPYVATSYKLAEGSNDAGGLPARYIIKSSIFIGFFFLLIQGISLIFSSLLTVLDKPQPDNEKDSNRV